MTNKVFELVRSLGRREFDPQETMNVLTSNKTIWWSWGVAFGKCSHKWIAFKVNGNHHKGYVCVDLGWDDLYRVTIISTHANIKQQQDGLYFDQIVEYIDEAIEKIPAYSN